MNNGHQLTLDSHVQIKLHSKSPFIHSLSAHTYKRYVHKKTAPCIKHGAAEKRPGNYLVTVTVCLVTVTILVKAEMIPSRNDCSVLMV